MGSPTSPRRGSAGQPASRAGVLLLAFGVAGICGNFIAGALVGARLRHTVLGIAVLLTAAMAALAVAEVGTLTAAALLIIWGLGYGAVPVALQTWMLSATPDRTEAASSLLVCAFNLSIAVGALLGGLAVSALPTAGVLWIGAGLAALTVYTLTPQKARV
ncbi:MFS transporter [Actinoplanes sp. NPDC024001]|uniref:MFS transporter n=1 Tax=Actinoplanes sp. NPDC024001 TaxID=3154598 RepID=UPI0033C421CD